MSHIFFPCLLLSLALINGSYGVLKIETFHVPPIVAEGTDVEMICLIDGSDTTQFMDLRWSFNNQTVMTYTFANKEVKFPWISPPGVNLNQKTSGLSRIRLDDVTIASSGVYKCLLSNIRGKETFMESYMKVTETVKKVDKMNETDNEQEEEEKGEDVSFAYQSIVSQSLLTVTLALVLFSIVI